MRKNILKNLNRENIIGQFIENFISKTRKERTYYELNNNKKRFNFIDRFNHCWEDMLDMRFITRIPSECNTYRYITQNTSLFAGAERCYIISEFKDIDDTFMDFEDAFIEIYGKGSAGFIISENAERIYLETEFMSKNTPRFIGQRLLSKH